ncbi:MAG TPA: hypothetical protein VFC42_05600 [Methylomirabilota bacterium]|jgi:hypothetical protein|nr:hypothetical protein [Methylomirabilota bacterium]
MVLVLTIAVGVCFFASLLPHLFPGTLIAMVGIGLNGSIGTFLAGVAPGVRPTLVEEDNALTLLGVVAVYVPVLALLVWGQRGR